MFVKNGLLATSSGVYLGVGLKQVSARGIMVPAEGNVVFRIKETVNLRAARLEQRGHPRLGEKKSFYTRGKAVARLALAEMHSRTPLFRERLWPHLETHPRCSLP